MPDHSRRVILWDSTHKKTPPRPEHPQLLPETDPGHWYDYEYAGWNVIKHFSLQSPADGPQGKRIIALLQGGHPYWTEYERGMRKEAARHGIDLEIQYADWDQDRQFQQSLEAVTKNPDLIIIVPSDASGGMECLKKMNEAGIPVIGSNQAIENEDHRYILSWTGPDDWQQHRLLARKFAEYMNGEGGYCIVSHRPGTSAYYARTWGVVTELSRIAPGMEILDVRFTEFERERTRVCVLDWIKTHGDRLKGIISADDSFPQEGINRAVQEAGREDIIRVANGATRRGVEFVREGSVKAITYQPPEVDGALPVRTAADWFNGFTIEPVRYLPMYIITEEDVDAMLPDERIINDVNDEELFRMIVECRLDDIAWFFEDLERRLATERIVEADYFRGFVIELLAGLMNVAKANNLDAVKIIGGHEMLFKGLFHQESASHTLSWVKRVSLSIVDELLEKRCVSGSLVDQMKAYVELHYREPLALKSLSDYFGLSAAYLGKIFKERTGISFSRYLNEFRIGKALAILESRSMKVKDVALDVGYSDPNYFCFMFKKITGFSHSEMSGK